MAFATPTSFLLPLTKALSSPPITLSIAISFLPISCLFFKLFSAFYSSINTRLVVSHPPPRKCSSISVLIFLGEHLSSIEVLNIVAILFTRALQSTLSLIERAAYLGDLNINLSAAPLRASPMVRQTSPPAQFRVPIPLSLIFSDLAIDLAICQRLLVRVLLDQGLLELVVDICKGLVSNGHITHTTSAYLRGKYPPSTISPAEVGPLAPPELGVAHGGSGVAILLEIRARDEGRY